MREKNFRLLILGCGYVGSAFAKEALQRGVKISALTHNKERASALKALGVTDVIETELESEGWHKDVNPEQDWVLNTVSAARGDGMRGYRRSYLEGQKSVMKWLSGGNVKVFIYTSSTSVYPQYNGEWVDEQSMTHETNERARILLEAERVVQEQAICQRWFILRLAGIYGPGRHFILDRLLNGESIFEGSGDFVLNLIHCDDICSALWSAFQASIEIKNEIFNVCDNQPNLKKTIINELARRLNCPLPTFDPDCATKRSRQRQLPNGCYPNRRISNEKIKKLLHWEPLHPSFASGYESILRSINSG